MFRTIILSLAIASYGGACFAQFDEKMPSVAVKYADLDLDTHQGAQALVDRLNAAAEHVCAAAYLTGVQSVDQVKACREGAVSNAIAAINMPLVYAAAHGGEPDLLAQR